MKQIDIMVDLETMSTKTNAAIVSIGAVAFKRGEIIAEFYRTINLASAVKAGGHLDPDTIMWWMGQEEKAKRALKEAPILIENALIDFQVWVHTFSQKIIIWGNGSAFDNVVMRTAYERLGHKAPWGYWDEQCYRTMKNQNRDVDLPERDGVHHNALDDARFQAEHLILIWEAKDEAQKGMEV